MAFVATTKAFYQTSWELFLQQPWRLLFMNTRHTSCWVCGNQKSHSRKRKIRIHPLCSGRLPWFWLYFYFYFFLLQFVYKILPENPEFSSDECSVDFQVIHTLEYTYIYTYIDVSVVKRNMDSKKIIERIKGYLNIVLYIDITICWACSFQGTSLPHYQHISYLLLH